LGVVGASGGMTIPVRAIVAFNRVTRLSADVQSSGLP
jgi:hypothetical protein